MEYNCKICNKEYSSYKSLWNHTNKFHKNDVNTVNTDVNTLVTNVEDNKLKCKYCNKLFTTRQGKSYHELHHCKENKKELITTSDKEINILKKQINLLQKSLKIHPKTLNKINNQLNNTNNGTINNNHNNTINIVQLGHENLSKILSDNQKINILNRQAMSINDLVELIHTSDKYIQFKNVYITNLQSSFGYRYEDKSKKFIAVSKNELLNDILESRMYDIGNFYSEIQYKMEPKRAERIKHFIEKMTLKPEMKNKKKDEIRLILYNNKESIISMTEKVKQNMKNSLLQDKKEEDTSESEIDI